MDVVQTSGRIVARAASRGITIAVAESLTGGLVAETLVKTPGASSVLRLGVVAYATEMKHRVLHVPADLLAERGPVDQEVAVWMARGVRQLAALDRGACTIGIATTGVAGPQPQDGHPPGEFHIGAELLTLQGPVSVAASHLVRGDREEVRRLALEAALAQLDAALERTDLVMHSESTS